MGAERLLPRPVQRAETRGGGVQFGEGRLARPIAFEREFELAAKADAGEAEGGDADSHVSSTLQGGKAPDRRVRTGLRTREARSGAAMHAA